MLKTQKELVRLLLAGHRLVLTNSNAETLCACCNLGIAKVVNEKGINRARLKSKEKAERWLNSFSN